MLAFVYVKYFVANWRSGVLELETGLSVLYIPVSIALLFYTGVQSRIYE